LYLITSTANSNINGYSLQSFNLQLHRSNNLTWVNERDRETAKPLFRKTRFFKDI